MKRSHDEIGTKKSPLGALEFAAALNGDDARAALQALVRFTKTVRRERRQALRPKEEKEECLSEDEMSGSEEEELGHDSLSKKRKNERAWMEDTEAFHVPFVGTSVAKGDTGTVVAGQWPTGLLQAYLKVSPMAVELTSGDLIPPTGHLHKRLLSKKSKHGTKASQAIYRAYFEALAQVITANVPISTLQRDYGIENSGNTDGETNTCRGSIASVILKERLEDMMLLINEESGGGKMMDRTLVANALRILANLSATSLGAAREVTRALDASLKDGILKSLLRARKISTSKGKNEDNVKMEQRDDSVRIECLRLATILAEWKDSAITAYITTKGSRERKIGPGIFYLAIRLGLNDSTFTDVVEDDGDNDEEYMQAVTRLLRAVRLLLLDSSDTTSKRPLLSTRDLVDLFSGDALVHISQVACCAPAYHDLTDGDSNSDTDTTEIEQAGLEGRRILFNFLANPTKSPFLVRMKHSKVDDNQVAHCAQQLVRAMMLLLQRCPSLSIQRFLIECLQTTPTLVPHFFKMVTVPDPKQSFAFIARMGFLFRLVREAPAVSSCIEKDVHFNEEHLDVVMASTVPANIKKHLLTKGLKTSNALIVSETLKFLYALIDRYRKCVADIGVNQESQRFLGLVTDATVRAFPDVQSLLSLRSIFDPFTLEGDTKAAIVVIGQFCKVLDSLALYLPAVLKSVKFDFMKLLPHDANVFCSTSPVLQYQLLSTLENVLELQEERSEQHRLSSSGIRLILEIVGTARGNRVYQKARSIAIAMIHSPLDADDSESTECIEYESSLWIDGMSEQCLDGFCSLLCDPSNGVLKHSIAVASAWKKADLGTSMPPVSFSPLISASVQNIPATTSSEPFVLFTCQVVTKCLLYQRYPLLLASLIVDSLANFASENHPVTLLYRYARNLLSRDKWDDHEYLNSLDSLLQCLFTHSCIQNKLMRSLREDTCTCLELSMAEFSINDDIKASVRQCLHVATLESISATIFQQLRTLIPLLIQNERPGEANSNLDTILGHPIVRSGKYPSAELAYIKIASFALPEEISSSECANQMNNFLVSTLLMPNQVPPEHVMREILRHTCQAITDKNTPGFVAYAALALYWMESHPANTSPSYIPLNAALDTWRVAVENSHFEKEATLRLAQALEARLSEAMETEDPKRASLLYSLILRSPPSETIQACIRCKQLKSHSRIDSNQSHQVSSLLSNLIAADPTLFGMSFLDSLAQPASKSDALQLLEGGFLDEEVAMLPRINNIVGIESFRSVQDAVVLRSLEALSNKPALIRAPRTTHVEDGLTSLLSLPEMIHSNHIDAFIQLASSALTASKPNKLASVGAVWSYLSHSLLCNTDPECALREMKPQKRLASNLLFHDLKRLHWCLKKHFKYTSQESKSESRLACLEALEQTTEFISIQTLFDEAILVNKCPDVMNDIVRSAIKYGLSNADDLDSKISERCLRLVRILIVEGSDPSSSLHLLKDQCLLLNPSTVLAMALSHSRFHEAMCRVTDEEADSATFSATLELVRLMLVCTSMSSDTVLFDHEVWSTILSVYNAGTTPLDVSLRRLLDVYADSLVNRGMSENLPRMEIFRWGGMARANDSSPNFFGWDWLVSGLEIARIRATISQFPVHDPIKSDRIKDVESWLDTLSDEDMSAMDVDEEKDVDISPGDSSSKDSDVSIEEGDATKDSPDMDDKSRDHELDVWKGLGKDIRYSPAFILPLILGALENSLSKSTHSSLHDQTMSSAVNGEEDGSATTKEFVVLTQRMVERGALSLALASLCSECSSLRKVAVATLAHIKKALDTGEARKLSTWRERPQLAMIVDSVQRGLAVRVAMRLDPHEQEPSWLNIPKLPALSAVFLARAALIIVKPGDQMFGPINRYFLRLDDGHGAFQDTNRLPAFISLFCSSATEPGQARRERLWALQLMKDSFVEEYCYRMIESCHAPELVMSNFQSIRSRQEDDQHDPERILLIDTLTSMLENGGRRAASHLIGRVGLLSWIRGQVISDDLIRLLPSLGSRIAFLRLTSVALSKSRLYLAKEDSEKHQLLMESRSMISDVIMLYDDSIRQGPSSFLDQRGTTTPALLAILSSDTLAVLVNIMKDLGSSEDVNSVQKYGIPLDRAIRMLQTTPQSLISTIILSLCIAPIRLDEPAAENAVAFCEIVLSFLSTIQLDEETNTAALKRVSLLISLMEKRLDAAGYGLVDSLLSSRRACLQKCRDAWFECLKEVIDQMDDYSSVPTSAYSLSIARDILESATGT